MIIRHKPLIKYRIMCRNTYIIINVFSIHRLAFVPISVSARLLDDLLYVEKCVYLSEMQLQKGV